MVHVVSRVAVVAVGASHGPSAKTHFCMHLGWLLYSRGAKGLFTLLFWCHTLPSITGVYWLGMFGGFHWKWLKLKLTNFVGRNSLVKKINQSHPSVNCSVNIIEQ